MTHIKDQLATFIASGLKRSSVKSCARWAEIYRVIKGQPWRFNRYPWLKEMHNADTELIVGQKAAQLGYTEWALNMTFYNIDVRCRDCLYILPSKDDATDFSSGRFDPALEASPHLKSIFSDVNNVGLKRAGQATLYVRGSRSRSKLKSIPTGFIVFDELDEMTQENIPLAMKRAAGQEEKQFLMISTPTLPNEGINVYYQDTTQEHFYFKCPSCSRLTELVFPECLVITAEKISDPKIRGTHIICKECHTLLPHETKHEWLSTGRFVPSYSDRVSRGFSVNEIYSPTTEPWELATEYLRSLYDPSAEQEFFNSSLGLPHVVEGAQITDGDINNCIAGYTKGPTNNGRVVTMGIDVGRYLHVVILEWDLPQRTPGFDINDDAIPRLIYEDEIYDETPDFYALDKLMRDYGVHSAVIDRHPSHRSAYSFAKRFWGRVLLCMYGQGINGKQLQLGTEEERTVTVDRTSWLDLSMSRFTRRRVLLPSDLSEMFKRHIKAPVRLYRENKDGQQVGYYKNTTPDHLAHAFNYAEIALPFAYAAGTNYDVQGIF